MTLSAKMIRRVVAALALAIGLSLGAGSRAGAADLFYNYYVPGYNGGPPAQLYLSPRPAPPLVGYTYVTYQPLMPHEYMYQHSRYYVSRGNGSGGASCSPSHRWNLMKTNYTKVRWCAGPLGGWALGRWTSPEIRFISIP